MVEAGRIDHACHANDAKGAIMDTLAFDEAIEEAYEFYMSHPEETLIVVVGDHETGGMGLGFANNYFLNMDELEDVDVSVEDTLQYADYDTLEEYLAYIDEHLGLDDLTAEEIAEIESAMSVETGANPNTYGSYYTPEAIAATHLLSERVNIQWTTFAHSATAIPMSAVGKGAQDFSGYKDNTEIAQAMAELMNFNLSR
jgi:alkaline phosphatase